MGRSLRLVLELPPDVRSIEAGSSVQVQVVGQDKDGNRVAFGAGRTAEMSATEGTAALEGIDKRALRRMLGTLADTVGASKEEINRFLRSLARAGDLNDKAGFGLALARARAGLSPPRAAGAGNPRLCP